MERETKVATGRGDTFGSAAAVNSIHGINPSSLDDAAMGTVCGGPDQNITEQFCGTFEYLELAEINRNIVLERLSTNTTTQYDKVEKLLSKISANAPNAAAATIGIHTLPTETSGTHPPRTTGTRTHALT